LGIDAWTIRHAMAASARRAPAKFCQNDRKSFKTVDFQRTMLLSRQIGTAP
jgi:hypothetical protein